MDCCAGKLAALGEEDGTVSSVLYLFSSYIIALSDLFCISYSVKNILSKLSKIGVQGLR